MKKACFLILAIPLMGAVAMSDDAVVQARPVQRVQAQINRDWGPEQATGEPNTPQAADAVTAWASLSADGQDEWLHLDYAESVIPTEIKVYENYMPGALSRVTVFKENGEEVEVWKGRDPTAPTADKGVSVIPVRTNFKTQRVKIYLDSKAVPGWNEIDAVALIDTTEKTQWAVAATASSSYADQRGGFVPEVNEERLASLEEKVTRLEAEIKKLRAAIEELTTALKNGK